ncbi:MAG: hypothetical protein N2645_13240 [Clostridia bacterium]|nr:hypothetical protein [Clostridia bacterium]
MIQITKYIVIILDFKKINLVTNLLSLLGYIFGNVEKEIYISYGRDPINIKNLANANPILYNTHREN